MRRCFVDLKKIDLEIVYKSHDLDFLGDSG